MKEKKMNLAREKIPKSVKAYRLSLVRIAEIKKEMIDRDIGADKLFKLFLEALHKMENNQ